MFGCKHCAYEHGEGRLFWFQGKSYEEAAEILRDREINRPQDFGEAMRRYLDLPIEAALKSSNPFIEAFALIDRRTGKRTNERLAPGESEHTLVKFFYNLRAAQNSFNSNLEQKV